jgi:serine/threonine protein kinase
MATKALQTWWPLSSTNAATNVLQTKMCVGSTMYVRAIGGGSYSSVYADDENAYKVLNRKLGENTHTVLREGLLLRLGYGVQLRGILTDTHKNLTGYVIDRGISSLSAWRARRPIEVLQLQFWCHDLLNGLSSLHASNIIHGDIKPANMIVFQDGSAALCDFGLSSLFTSAPGGTKSTDEIFTMLYRPPELLFSDGPWTIDAGLDVWAFGISLYEILFGKTPFYDGKRSDIQSFLDISVPDDFDACVAKFKKDLRICCCEEAQVFAEPMARALSRTSRISAWALLQLIPKPTLTQRIILESRLPVQPLQPFEHEVLMNEPSTGIYEAIVTRQLCYNVAKLVQFPCDRIEAYVTACSALFNVLHGQCGDSRGLRAVIACTLCMYVFRPCDCLKPEWLAKLANTSVDAIKASLEKCLVPAIQDPSWAFGIWCSFSTRLGPTYV